MKKPSKNSVQFIANIFKFGNKGEKTGWTYIEVSAVNANVIFPGNKKSFRVKGALDNHSIKGMALMPMGDGKFIMPLNAAIRKAIGKEKGSSIAVTLQLDSQKIKLNTEMMTCIRDEPSALEFFQQLAPSHQNYFSKWVESAKTYETKANRIARIVNALARKMNYAEMLRSGV